MPFSNVGVYQKITRWSLYLLTFLLPIFFLPMTSNVLEINKQSLLVILSFVALVAWLGAMVIEKRLRFASGWFNLAPAVLLIGVLVSSILSLSGYQTWVGQLSQEYTSFLTTATFVLLFYVLMNACSETTIQKNLFFALIFSSVISGLVTLLGLFGVFIVPFNFAHSVGFNFVGTMNSFGEYMTVISILSLGLWLVAQKGKDDILPSGKVGSLMRVLIMVQIVMTIATLLIIDYWVLWVLMIFGILLLCAFAFIQQRDFPGTNRFSLPLFGLIVSILFLFVSTPIHVAFPGVISPSLSSSLSIVKQTFARNIPTIIFGSGPGTFVYDYANFKPIDVNQTDYWSVNFDRADTDVLTKAGTLGVLGILLWLAFVVWLALKALNRLIREREHDEWRVTYVVFCAWATMVLLHFLATSNMTVAFVFWLLTGLLASQVMVRIKEADFTNSPKLGLVTSFTFILVAVCVVAGLFVTGQRYVSEAAFAKAITIDSNGGKIDDVVTALAQATSTNQLSDIYYRNLSSVLLVRVGSLFNEIQASGKQATQEQTQQLQSLVAACLSAAQRATALEPNNVDNWAIRGGVYRELIPLVNGAQDLAAASFVQAMTIEPNNPGHVTDLARTYLAVADHDAALKSSTNADLAKQATDGEKDALSKAEEQLNKAIALKANYAPAHYYLAAVYERQGKLDDAAARLAALRDYAPLDMGIGFQLSQLYIRQHKYDLAKTELTRLIGLDDKYSNARWYLASIDEMQGDLKGALEQVQKVAELNPDNKLVADRLAKLKAGETTISNPPPVEAGSGSATDTGTGEVTNSETP